MKTLTIIFLSVLSIVCCGIFVNSQTLNLPKGCSSDAVAMAAEFIAHSCNYISSLKCLTSFAECYGKAGYDLVTPVELCSKELNDPDLSLTNPTNFIAQACNTEGTEYFKRLQTYCCLKDKDTMLNNLTWTEARNINARCYDKVNCPEK